MLYEEEHISIRIDKYGKKILSSYGGSYTKPIVGKLELVRKMSIRLIKQGRKPLLDIKIQYECTKMTYTSQQYTGNDFFN